MKKILFCVRDLSTGGVQRSLINLLKALKPSVESKELQVDLFVLKHIGELSKDVPKFVKIIEANKKFWPFGVSNAQASQFSPLFKFKRMVKAAISKIFTNSIFINRALNQQDFLGEYDAVISFAVSISNRGLYAGWAEAALEKTKSNNKMIYIHNDFLKSGLNNDYTVGLIKKFNKILFVSNGCKTSFVKAYPELKEKCYVLYNLVDSGDIIKKAKLKETSIQLNFDVTNFISVSRLSSEKGYLRSLAVMRKLKDDGFKFVWHVLGDGPMKSKIEREIARLRLEECVKLYGNQENPYKFIKVMDFLYLGSIHESFGLVLIESMILGVPVLTTKTISAEEIVGNFGFICENREDGIYEKLKEIFSNSNQLKLFKENLKNYIFNNEIIIEKFRNLL